MPQRARRCRRAIFRRKRVASIDAEDGLIGIGCVCLAPSRWSPHCRTVSNNSTSRNLATPTNRKHRQRAPLRRVAVRFCNTCVIRCERSQYCLRVNLLAASKRISYAGVERSTWAFGTPTAELYERTSREMCAASFFWTIVPRWARRSGDERRNCRTTYCDRREESRSGVEKVAVAVEKIGVVLKNIRVAVRRIVSP